jgi:hypothetical protein
MRLLELKNDSDFILTNDLINNIPPYAILSHTWGTDTEEVSFKDLFSGTGESKSGYEKIRFCGEQARRDGLQYFWVDTCCIDKSNSTELQEAINSMFRWYRNAAKCYVYLADVSTLTFDASDKSSQPPWESVFRKSKWFTRGWTLQELIAPASVEFFSKEGVYLGNEKSLEQYIHNITGIPLKALQGSPLSGFRVTERMVWIEKRETTRKEDKAYSLLGIFDVHMPLIYGEGERNAFKRLREEINKASKSEQTYGQSEDRYLADLRSTDPRHDKARIEKGKGGLLRDSYRWVLDNAEFKRWRDEDSRLLWIKGDPGKGKTMLLCGIIDELRPSTKLAGHADGALLSYFFCQATDSRINSATAVLRGLIYLLVDQQPALLPYVRNGCGPVGEPLFRDVNAWVALSKIFEGILDDPSLKTTYLVIDALDECENDLSNLLEFIVAISTASRRVKWLLSSRNMPDIERKLKLDNARTKLSLEREENALQVSRAVDVYVDHELSRLESLQDDSALRDHVQEILRKKAKGTFLWVALVVQELEKAEDWHVRQVVEEVPTSLNELYNRMVDQMEKHKRDSKFCRLILSTVTVTYRPLHLSEIGVLSGVPNEISSTKRNVARIVAKCGSFLTVQDDRVYLVHQSARDYLNGKARAIIFPSGPGKTHHSIFSRSLKLMSETLTHRDIYGLCHPGASIDKVKQPDPDPLATVRYSCIYWVGHLCDSVSDKRMRLDDDLQDSSTVHTFLKARYLYWLEALSLLGSMSEGVIAMQKLENLIVSLQLTMLYIYDMALTIFRAIQRNDN